MEENGVAMRLSLQATGVLAVFAACILLGAPRTGSADIYRYKDENGVWHFTNIKSDSRYRLYLKSPEKRAAEYIEKYGSIIKQASAHFEVEPSLIKAVIKAESGFNHRAVSHKGAQGLMQLMPSTADLLRVNDPFDPTENIFGGTRYLKQLLDRFNDMRLAVAAYNAGPEAVENYRGIPPYEETQVFVKRVIDYYNGYQKKK
ncbi:MAG: lytic transglycosylase domain-containing protein [Desulfobacteraceae bacterium]